MTPKLYVVKTKCQHPFWAVPGPVVGCGQFLPVRLTARSFWLLSFSASGRVLVVGWVKSRERQRVNSDEHLSAGKGGQNLLTISDCGSAVFRPFPSDASSWPKSIVSGQGEGIMFREGARLPGIYSGGSPLQGLAIIPRHPSPCPWRRCRRRTVPRPHPLACLSSPLLSSPRGLGSGLSRQVR